MSDLLAPVGNLSPDQREPQEQTNSKPAKKAKAYPLSYAQQRLWLVDQLEPGSHAYVIPRLLQLKGELSLEAFYRSLEEIVRRHEILRTSFVSREGTPYQRIWPDAELGVEEIDLRGVPEAEREAEAIRRAQAAASEPFDLQRRPLLRVKLLQVAEDEYLLSLTMHHIVSDGWSMGIMVREFAALYQAFSSGRPSPLPPLKIQYLDYTMWQRNWLQGEVLEGQLGYWRKQLHGVPALDMPVDHGRPPQGSEAGATLHWTLSQSLSTQLQQLSHREGSTLFMTLLAAFQVLLARYSGQKDIAIGSPIAGRRLTETEDLIGFFINTLVLRTDWEGNPSFRELLRRVQETTLNAYAHQDVPFEKLVEELRPERDLSRTALFQAMFVLQNAPISELELPGLKLSEIQVATTAAKFELELMVIEQRGALTGVLIYRSDLFHEASMKRLLGYWQNLLADIAEHPQKAIQELSMLTEAERRQLLEEWNCPLPASRQKPVHELFTEQVERRPDAIALEYGPRRLTYAELDHEAWGHAQGLRQAGAAKGDLVLIFTHDRVTLIATMIGALRAGCAFVPMSPQLPDQRIATMMAECTPAWAVVDPGLEERFAKVTGDSGQNTRVVGSIQPTLNTPPKQVEPTSGDELSYIFFTSGSTGKPKAIAGRLRGIDHFVRWEIEKFGIGPGSRISQLTTLMFDPILRDVFVPLCSGGTVCIPAEAEIVMNGNGLATWIEQERITLIHMVPSIFRLMVNQCESSIRFPNLKYLLLAGEQLLSSDIKNWHSIVGADGAQLVNVYGPSETTMAKFMNWLEESDQWRRIIPIGKPMSGSTALLVDEAGQACPPGISGEVYIRTPYRSLGYYRQPELTAQSFVPNPFSNDPEDIVYKTGDLARALENGNFELIGRRDHQVKVRGVRIELAEIEAALSAGEGVAQAVAMVVDDHAGGKRLAGYVVPRSGLQLNLRDLQNSVRKQLPEYMVPSVLMALDALPLTPNGKVDRSRLPEPEAEVIESEYVAPRTAEEEILCGIWQELLKRKRVGIEESFFELGGHSLMATQLMARVRTALNMDLPLRMLFEAPTVAALTERIQQQRSTGEGLEAPPLRRVERDGPIPLSFTQQRLWVLDQLQPLSSAYNMSIALRIKGRIEPKILQRALDELVRRHEVLRTRFTSINGEARQLIDAVGSVQMSLVDLSARGSEEREAEARRQAQEEAETPFDLTKWPLLRVKLLRLSEDDDVLLVTMHHIVSDGWSLGIIVKEFATLYQAYSREQPSPLPELKVQYADYAMWQREWLQGEVLERQVEYWKQQLSGLAVLELPTDRPRPPLMTQNGAMLSFRLSTELTGKLQALSLKATSTLFMTMLAGFQSLLSRYSGQQDIAVGSPIAGRTRTETEGLIGFFVNNLVLRTRWSGQPGFRTVLEEVRTKTLEAYGHQEVPLEKLVEELQPERDLSRSPLFQVVFAGQNIDMGELQLPGLELSRFYYGDVRPAKFDLLLAVAERDGGILGTFEYNTDLFDAETVVTLGRRFELLLEQVVRDPAQSIERISLLSEEEREVLAQGWRGPEIEERNQQSVPVLIAAQAEQRPNAAALVVDGKAVSYGELNRRANRLANYLRKQGVKLETRVGICLENAIELVVTALAVLKCGGVVVGLDADEPQPRLSKMLRVAETELVITESGLAERFVVEPVRLLCVEEYRQELAQHDDSDVQTKLNGNSLACVLYRSVGESGPVGVLLSHGGLCGGAAGELGRKESDRVALSLSFADEMAWQESFRVLASGGCLVHLPSRPALPPRKLANLLREQKVTVLWATGEVLERIGREFAPVLKNVRQIICKERSGALERLREAFKAELQERVYGCFGASEAGGWVVLHGLAAIEEQQAEIIKMGQMAAGSKVYVLDENLEPAPEQIVGEIYVGGEGLALGYAEQTARTATSYVPNPYSEESGGRLYRTGERARRRKDGKIEYRGRKDGWVVLGGVRVAAEEIEAVLREHADVKDAAVVARESAGGELRLEAVVLVRDGQTISGEEMKSYVGERLPEAMAPETYTTVEAIARLKDGEVDRRGVERELREKERAAEAPEYVAPRNEMEEKVAEIWAQTFGVEQVGVHDNFFHLGGHSLLAIQVVARISDVLRVELPLRKLFESPTVAELTERVTERIREAGETGRSSAPPLVPVETAGPVPLSYSQERLWFVDQMEPDSSAYNIAFGMRFTGKLNKEAMNRSLNEIVRRHEVLRTTFPAQDGKPTQVIASELQLALEEIDLSGLPDEAREQAAREHARIEAQAPFDLAKGPLLRAKLLRMGDEDHVALATMHHMVSDGWSIGIIVREFSRLYEAFSKGAGSPLEELKIQYSDFAVWQRSWLQGEVLEEQLGYWKEQLASMEVLNLPTDHARKALTSNRSGRNVDLQIGREMIGKLRAAARSHEATLFMLLVAALDVVLWRYSEQSDIAIGTGIANRNRVEIEGLIGFFVNNLVLRTQTEGQISTRELLERVRHTTLEAYRHPDISFEKLVAELQPERDLTRTPLFQVALVLQNFTHETFSLPDLTVRGYEPGQTAAKLDLTLMIVEDQEQIRVTFNYDTELYEQATVERLASHWRQVLGDLTGDVSRPVNRLSLMTTQERRHVLEQWAGADDRDIWAGGIGKLFARQVEQTPETAAVIWPDGEMTYRELGKRVWQMARYLRELGVAPEERVVVCLEPGPDLIVAILGAAGAGAAYVPLDPDYPAERLTQIVADTQPAVLITDEKYEAKLPGSRGTVVCMHRDSASIARHSTDALEVEVKPGHLLYVIYTSGSTGKPKGVAISQGSLVSRADFVSSWYQIGSRDRHIQTLSPSFDAFNGGMFSGLLSGGALVFARAEKLLDPEELLSIVRRKRVTLLRLAVGYLREILSYLLRNKGAMPDSARLLVTGGETVSRPEMKDWLRRAAPNARFIHEYGPTETTITAALREDDPALEIVPYLHRAVIGKPNADTKLYVLEENMSALPAGVPGELYIGGAGVGRGYVQTPDLTAEKFVPDPFSHIPGKRLYRTGDWVRWLEDGSLEFLGRRDEQVKVNGYRIELGEIEAALRQHPGLREAVVVVREDEPGNKRLAGYVVSAVAEAPAPATAELRKWLLEKLPEYMVPSIFVELTELPLMPGGKLDRKRLPKPSLEIVDGQITLARTPVEQILCDLWSELLKREQVGVEENFFELGGHSLLATQVIARIRNVFNVELPLRALFESPTIAGLAERIEQFTSGESALTAPPITRADRSLPLPLSFAQQRLWFIHQLEPDNLGYNTGSALMLKGELNIDVLEKTFRELVRRHEVLRTRFETVDGEARQVIAPESALSIPLEDLSALPPGEALAQARQRVVEVAAKPFDLAKGPLLRVNLLRVAPQEHVMAVIMHHIVCDGWSVGIIVRELSALYEAFVKGEESPLEELQIQYADFSVWQRNWLQGPVLDDQLQYWRKQLADVPPLELPSDFPRSVLGSDAGAKLRWEPSEELIRELKDLSRREGVTLFMTLIAGLQLLLSRYSRQKDVTVGTPIAGRRWTEIEPLIGFLANTLVLRANLSEGPTFKELLGQVRETTLEAYRHQDVPFEKLVEELRPERDLSRTPFFQVMLVLQNVPYTQAELPGVKLSTLEMGADAARFDWELNVVDTGGKVGGVLVYRTNLFAEASMRKMLGHFENLLGEIVKDVHRPVSELAILTPAERQQIVVEWNRTEARYEKTNCVLELFEKQVEETPTAVALECGEAQLTYAELNAQANQVAHYLRKLGIRAERTVGISARRDLQLLVGILGILKSGGAYVPLDPTYPPARRAYMLEDSKVEFLLTQEQFLEEYSSFPKPILCLDRVWPEIAQHSQENPNIPIDGANLAFLVYTSGSTGKPKGVAMLHGALTNLIHWQRLNSAGGRPFRTIQFTSVSFDVSFQEIFSTWCAGGSLVLVDEDTRRDPFLLWQIIRNKKVERIFLPFVALQQLAEVADIGTSGPAPLLEVITAGEQLKTTPVLQKFFEHLPGVPFENHYGPSETHVITVHRLGGIPSKWPALPPVGKTIANGQVYVLDEAGEPVPIGVVGEVFLGGVCLARGYMNRPDWTAERFVPHHLSTEPGKRLYRAGDLARQLPNSELEFMGRKDHQVKLRGHRIELGEIEAVLQEHPQVGRAAVAVREDRPGEKRLVAYLVRREKSLPPHDGLRKFLRDKLPDHMIPALFVELEEMPLTPSGKMDRKLLPKPEQDDAVTRVAPKTAVEETLCRIWAELLRHDQIGTQDNFFDLGGHSLLATRVISRIRLAFGVDLPVRLLFENPTVAGLAECIERQKGEAAADASPIERVGRDKPLPLSYAQQRLWLLDQLQPLSSAYNMGATLRLQGEINQEILQRVVNELVARHEVLRTRFELIEGEARQVIGATDLLPVVLTDLSHLAAEERETEARKRAKQEARAPFDLAHGPLFRVKLLRLAEQDHVLIVTMHHIVTDGWSLGIMVREFAALYQAYAGGQPSPLQELKIQYADYAVWQREWLQGEVLERQMKYWKQQLAGVAPLELPIDRPRPPLATQRGASLTFSLPAELTSQLHALSLREKATLFMTLLTGFQLLLSRYTGQEDIAVGSPIAGRTRSETEGLIGFFVNTLVLRTRWSGQPSFRALLEEVRVKTLEAYGHQDVPFEKLVEELHPERDLSRSPLFQVMFAVQNMEMGDLQLPGVKLSQFDYGTSNASKFEMLLALMERDGSIHCGVEYNTDLFDAETVVTLGRRFQMLLEQAVQDPAQSIGRISLLSAVERELLAQGWSGPAIEEHNQQSVPALIAEQAEQKPKAAAIVADGKTVSYGELNRRANQLANYLRKQGVKLETRVGICLENAVELVVTSLAALKCGGVVVGLDADEPQPQLSKMLRDAATELVITESGMAGRFAGEPVRLLRVEEYRPELAQQDDSDVQTKLDGNSLACVLFRSAGEHGPVGVLLNHGGLCTGAAGELSRKESDRVALSLSFADEMAWQESFRVLASGGCLVHLQSRPALPPRKLANLLREQKVTVLWATGEVLERIGREFAPVLKNVRQIICKERTGALEKLREFFKAELQERVYGCYGASEAGGWVVLHGLAAIDEQQAEIMKVEQVAAGSKVYVLDENLEPVPEQIVGEIYVGGVGLALGYEEQTARTAISYVPNPYSEESGGRLYRTGERARPRKDGKIEYRGRKDGRVVLGGVRVAAEEIEAVLREHAEVKDAAVMAREGAGGELRLEAVVVAREGQTIPGEELKSYVGERLPEAMAPETYTTVEAIARLKNGEIDRRRVERELREKERAAEAPEYVAPRNEMEEKVAEIWAQTFGVEQVGVHDNFFRLGGHSLLATQMVARISDVLHVELPLRKLFEAPTVAELAKVLERPLITEDKPGSSILVEIQPGGSRTPFFCVHPVGGQVLCYSNLAAELGQDQPFYGLQSPGRESFTQPEVTIAEMADLYLQEVRRVQPRGPYVLGGWSMGGLVAFEMARKLKEVGETIGLLALFDTHAVVRDGSSTNGSHGPSMLERFALDMCRLVGVNPNELGERFLQLNEQEQMTFLAEQLARFGVVGRNNAHAATAKLVETFTRNEQAMDRYIPEISEQPLVLFAAADSPYPDRLAQQWQAWAGAGTEIHQVPSDHYTLLRRPHVSAIAEKLKRRLAGIAVDKALIASPRT